MIIKQINKILFSLWNKFRLKYSLIFFRFLTLTNCTESGPFTIKVTHLCILRRCIQMAEWTTQSVPLFTLTLTHIHAYRDRERDLNTTRLYYVRFVTLAALQHHSMRTILLCVMSFVCCIDIGRKWHSFSFKPEKFSWMNVLCLCVILCVIVQVCYYTIDCLLTLSRVHWYSSKSIDSYT